MLFFCKRKPPNPRRKWQQHPLKNVPWTSIFAILGVILLGAASAVILYHSDGKVTSDWSSQRFALPVVNLTPSVLLATSAVLSNTLLRFSLFESQPVFWWRKALRPDGTTIHDLHNYYEHGHSVLESLGAGRSINLMSLSRIITTLAVIQGPLFQRSSQVVLNHSAIHQINITLPVSVNLLPKNFTSAALKSLEGRAATNTQQSNLVSFTYEFSSVLKGFDTQEPIVLKSKCNGICIGALIAAGFDVDCRDSTYGYDLSNPSMQTVISTNISFSGPGVTVRTSHKPNSQLGCTGNITFRDCLLRPAIVRYNFTLERGLFKLKKRIPGHNDTIKLHGASGEQRKEEDRGSLRRGRRATLAALAMQPRDVSSQVSKELQSAQVSHSGCPLCAKRREVAPQKTAPEYRGFYGIALAAGKKYDSFGILIPSMRFFAVTHSHSSLPYEYVSSDKGADGTCAMTWNDPTDDILEGIREIVFRAAVAASKASNASQSLEATEQTQQLIYKSDFRYLYAALAVPLLAVLGIIALFYGWWELGRTVSLSPIEIAKAFDAPLLKGRGTNAEIEDLLGEIGSTRVRYGEAVVRKNAASNSEMSLIGRGVKREASGSRYGDDEDDKDEGEDENNNDDYDGRGNEEGSSGARFLVMGAPGDVSSPVEGAQYE